MNVMSLVKGMLFPIITRLALKSYTEGKEDFEKGEYDPKKFKKGLKDKMKEEFENKMKV